MLKTSLAVVALLPIAIAAPQTAAADTKDFLGGALLGAVVTEAIRNSQKSQSQRTQTMRRTTPQAPATLNSGYSVAERQQIQTMLNARGFPVGTVDGVLGRNSRNAIGQFQASLGQPVTGQLTRAQFAALSGSGTMQPQLASDRALQVQEVVLLQQSLSMLGLYRGGIDGVAGAGTQQAAANFRAQRGLGSTATTQVQTLVMAATQAGLQVPPYLMQEAQSTMATAPFGAPAQQGFAPQQAFGTQPQPGFGAQPQQAFGAQPQQGFGTQPQQTFGAQQAQPVFGAQPQQAFGVSPQSQQGFGSAPAGGVPTGIPAPAGQTPLFGAPAQATGVPQQGIPQMQPQAAPQTAQQPLFAPQQQAPGVQPGLVPQQQAPLQQQPAPTQVPQGQGQSLFASGTLAPQPQMAPAQQQGGLDIYSPAPAGTTQVAGGVPAPTFGTSPGEVPNAAAFTASDN